MNCQILDGKDARFVGQSKARSLRKDASETHTNSNLHESQSGDFCGSLGGQLRPLLRSVFITATIITIIDFVVITLDVVMSAFGRSKSDTWMRNAEVRAQQMNSSRLDCANSMRTKTQSWQTDRNSQLYLHRLLLLKSWMIVKRVNLRSLCECKKRAFPEMENFSPQNLQSW